MVYDELSSDGRFVLHTIAAEGKEHCVYWLACGSWTERLIRQGLQKLGSNNNNLTVKCLAELLTRDLDDTKGQEFSEEALVRSIFNNIKEWTVEHHQQTCWIFLDDITALSTLVGEKLAYMLTTSVMALENVGVLVRASVASQEDKATENGNASWFADRLSIQASWEQSIAELADGIIDVLPLATGPTRQAHGRLLFTQVSERGWRTNHQPLKLVNYSLSDNKVAAIRIQNA